MILAAGAIGSPHILMLSGIGPTAHLAAHDIPVIADLRSVGQDLQDHIGGGPVSAVLNEPLDLGGQATGFDAALARAVLDESVGHADLQQSMNDLVGIIRTVQSNMGKS